MEQTTKGKTMNHEEATKSAFNWGKQVFEMTTDFPTAKMEEQKHHDEYCTECKNNQ
jgi:hypothetical protein